MTGIDGGLNGSTACVVANQTVVAEFFGVPRRTVEEWRKVGMPGRRGHYNLSYIYRWLRSRETKAIESDALEWHRREKARIAQLDRRRLEGELVRVDEVRLTMLHIAATLREAGDKLQRIYGPEAGDMHNEAIDAVIVGVEKLGDDSGQETINR